MGRVVPERGRPGLRFAYTVGAAGVGMYDAAARLEADVVLCPGSGFDQVCVDCAHFVNASSTSNDY